MTRIAPTLLNLPAAMRCTVLAVAGWCATFVGPAAASPVARDAALPAAALALTAVEATPLDAGHWMREEVERLVLARSDELGQREILLLAWQQRPPTWIQASALANLGEYPSLDDSAEKAQRDLQTLQWVIEQQQREASTRQSRAGEEDTSGSAPNGWLQRLLPQHWIQLLKANREWVLAGGTTLLLIVWGASIFARRPQAGPLPTAAADAADAPAKRSHRRRRRRRSRLQWQ